mmetsp:Transcript_122291/g.237842  ORF Transcript_122291/g.237842 Transcript_122291/m.237842 type:complete len:856 (+) Transcript_122291:73-2640(+)
MASRQGVPACGFGVGATKKGELPLRIEKRARGKKVTLIPNVVGDASKLARALMGMLGVGGTARQGEKGSWAVEVQGEQTARVTQALIEFKCIQGLTKDALEALRSSVEPAKETSVVTRNAATRFLAQTQEGKALSPQEERRKAQEQEAAFYSRYLNLSECSNLDTWDAWEDQSLLLPEGATTSAVAPAGKLEQSEAVMNSALRALGMIAECGLAVRQFWETSGLTVDQIRKKFINPGARLIDEAGRRKEAPSNLKSRQKLGDFRSGGARINYFSATCSVIDDYQRGIVRSKQKREAGDAARQEREQPKMLTSEDAEGWCLAQLSYCAPFVVPATRLDDEQRDVVSKKAMQCIELEVNRDLDNISQNIVGVECCLDCSTFGLNLTLRERSFLLRKDGGKAPDKHDKEEMKLEKKLRDISRLRERELEGEVLEKLQREKVLRRSELFQEVAELKLRRAEKQLLKIFKQHTPTFQDKFWDLEFKALYGGDTTEETEVASGPTFGAFDIDCCDDKVTISADGSRAESSAMQWLGVQLHLAVREGEVGAFAVEVLEGLVRLGWAPQSSRIGELGADRSSYGFGGTGKKVHGGVFETYGQPFKAGDEIHCEAERDGGRLRIGFAKNSKPLGIAFDVVDNLGTGTSLAGVVCGRGFKARLISAEAMPLEEAPILDGFVEYDPARLALAARNFSAEDDDCLTMWAGETVNVISDDGKGWLFGYFLDPEDPDDGGWFPVDAVQFVDEGDAPSAAQPQATLSAVGSPKPSDDMWDAPPPVAAAASTHAIEPSSLEPTHAEAVEGLADWLRGLSLQQYQERAIKWCQEMGALDVHEIEENWEDFADALSLKRLERNRLSKAAAASR